MIISKQERADTLHTECVIQSDFDLTSHESAANLNSKLSIPGNHGHLRTGSVLGCK